jgi:hypothetical protein
MHSLMSLDVFTTVRLWSLVKYMTNWRVSFRQWAGSAASTQYFGMWIGITSTNLARFGAKFTNASREET